MSVESHGEVRKLIFEVLQNVIQSRNQMQNKFADAIGGGDAVISDQSSPNNKQQIEDGFQGLFEVGIPVKISSETSIISTDHARVSNQTQEVFIAQPKGEIETGEEGADLSGAEGVVAVQRSHRKLVAGQSSLRSTLVKANLFNLQIDSIAGNSIDEIENMLLTSQLSLNDAIDIVQDTVRRQDRLNAPVAEAGYALARPAPEGDTDVHLMVAQAIEDQQDRQKTLRSTVREAILESIIGVDDRTQVTATTEMPWRYICSLEMQWTGRGSGYGTGWLAGPRTVITAGHVVYDRSNGLGWPDKIVVTPGHNGVGRGSIPFGQYISTSFHTVSGWVLQGIRECDYGAILLPDDAVYRGHLIGDYVGYFSYRTVDDHDLAGLLVNTAGYPYDYHTGAGNKPRMPFSMWKHNRMIVELTPELAFYDADTYAGQSGSPVWWYQNGRRNVVAIHNYGTDPGSEYPSARHNSGTRITSMVKDNIDWWVRNN